ncbi:nuclear speckle splicing regulatory protein 1 [Halyomorpha halys]|uniref:nuclear speckle splicing regulatory protein 1 n=1 Tax=Halyomorpha halys TaxID=286706 RepID=UPI0006D4FB7F|nr:nuclear speckle splicing regulatory protein 1 [Halyomorpha halys]
MSSNKQYGLQIPKKNTHGLVQKHAAFGDDSDSEKSEGGTDWAKKALKIGDKGSIKRQTKIDMQRALEQDSTVYQYDEVYDQMEKGKQEKHREKDRKPKYIQKLLVSAEKRKIENERRIERQVQKEREAEGDEFKDKETFVTAAYKKKLEEFAKLDAEQRRQDMLEDICDVSKQQDISGFYRHLYQQTMNGPKDDSPSKNSVSKDESDTPKKDSSHRQTHQSGNGHNEDNLSKNNFSKEDKKSDSKKVDLKKERQYRKRKESESSIERNKDSDGDSSSSSSSSGESDSEKSSHSETEDPKRIRSKEYSSTTELLTTEAIPISEPVILPQSEPQRSIWEKRTVGHVFDAALKRYLERKSARLAAVS